MKKFMDRFKKHGISDDDENQAGDDYVELNTETTQDGRSKLLVRPFVINDFSDIKVILDSLREGSTIALVNIRPLKDKDLVELKRSINKLKKTTEAIDGDIAGFGDDYIVITPNAAQIFRGAGATKVAED